MKFRKRKKKFLGKFFTCCVVVIVCLSNIVPVYAVTGGVRFISGNYRVTRGRSWAYGQYGRIWMGGRTAFCIQPETVFGGGEYSSEAFNDCNISKISAFIPEADHNDDAYVAAQEMIWGNLGWGFTSRSGRDFGAVEYWKNVIQDRVNRFNTRLSFNGQTITVKLGQPVTLTDHNNVLGDFCHCASNSGNVDFHRNGNQLTITVRQDSNLRGDLIFRKNIPIGNPLVHRRSGSQTVITGGYADPPDSWIHLNIIKTGKVIVRYHHRDIERGVDLKVETHEKEGLVGEGYSDSTAVQDFTRTIEGTSYPYRKPADTSPAQISGSYEPGTKVIDRVIAYSPPKVLKYQPYDAENNQDLGKPMFAKAPVYTGEKYLADEDNDGYVDGLNAWMETGQGKNLRVLSDGTYFSEVFLGLSPDLHKYDPTIQAYPVVEDIQTVRVPYYMPTVTADVEEVTIDTAKANDKLPTKTKLSLSLFPEGSPYFTKERCGFSLVGKAKGRDIETKLEKDQTSPLEDSFLFDSTLFGRGEKIPLEFLLRGKTRDGVRFRTKSPLETNGYTAAQRIFTEKEVKDLDEWEWTGVIQTTKKRSGEYTEKKEGLGLYADDLSRIWYQEAKQTSGYPINVSLRAKFTSELKKPSGLHFEYHEPSCLMDENLQKEAFKKRTSKDEVIIPQAVKNLQNKKLFDVNESAEGTLETQRVCPPHLWCESSPDGLLFTEEMKDQSKNPLFSAGNRLYLAIWPKHLAEDIEAKKNQYTFELASTGEFGVHANRICLGKEVTVPAFMYCHMNSPTKKLDEKKISPVFPNDQKAGDPHYHWSKADEKWFHEWLTPDGHVKEVGDLKKTKKKYSS